MMVWFRGWSTWIFVTFLVLSLSTVGCGSDDSEKSACSSTTCSSGVCDTDTGACVNPDLCDDSATCLAGFTCLDGSCDADFPCESTDECPAGACINGACLNPDTCSENSDCIPGFGCEDDVCVEDVCAQVTCDRGVCSVLTGECVNAEVCTNATETTDCVEGSVCLGQTCVDEMTFCDQLECDRGVCDFANKACGNAGMCSGDTECVAGFFCENGTCATNQCDANMVDCPRGICEPTTSTCVNADSCSALADCVDGYYCIQGACEEVATACADCDGNQVCDYVENTQAVFCLENPLGCVNANDCLDTRICEQGACQTASACVPDALEPNEDVASATDWNAAIKVGDRVPAAICQGDTDVFNFNVDLDSDTPGILIAQAVFATEDVGLGELSLELLDPSGTVVGSGVSSNGVARAEATIGNLNRGVYSARLVESGAISVSGINYGMFFDVAPAETIAACNMATELTGTVNGDTTSGSSVSLGGSCVTDRDAPEDVYTFSLTERSFVSMELTPTGRSTDLTLDLRTSCEIDGSSFLCLPTGTTTSQYEGFLDPGDYFVIIQSITAMGSGPYTLSFTSAVPVCMPGEAMCVDADNARACNAQGTGFDDTVCDQGCDMAEGRCTRTLGDVCYVPEDATGGIVKTLNWEDYQNDYDPGVACVGGTSEAVTEGQDAAFEVVLQSNEGMIAEITPGTDDAALYVVRNCDDVARTCVAGVNSGGSSTVETVAYVNSSADTQTVYVIADVSSNEFSFDPATLVITQGAVICTPGELQCSGSTSQTCNIGGLGFTDEVCSFGCDAQTGGCIPPPNDVCGPGAIDVSAGGSFSGIIDEYNNDYAPTSSQCTGDTAPGADAAFQLTGTPGDVVTLTVTADFNPHLYAVTDCANLDTCLAGADEGFTAIPETIRFNIPDTNPVFIIVDGDSSFSTTGAFQLDVQIQTPDCVTPGEPIACQSITTLDWCDAYGITQQYTCTGDCVATSCVTPTGDFCHDAIPLGSNGTYSGTFADFTDVLDPGTNGCIRQPGAQQDGPDAIFRVNLLANETLVADLATSDSGAGMYIMKGCVSAEDNCAWAAPRSNQLEFFAETAGDYFLVVDSTSFSPTAAFGLTLSSRFGDFCQPGGATCSGNVITECNATGSAVQNTITCATGCSFGTCNPPATLNDTCADAYVVNGPVRIYDRFERFNDDYNPGSAGCTGRSEPGLEHVYAITLAPNEVLAIDFEAYGSFIEPSAYLVSDCTDVTTSCVWGVASDSELLKDGYLNDTGANQNLFLMIDSDSSFDDEPYVLDLDIRPFECTQGAATCLDANTLQFCTSYGLFETERCFFGCTGGACSAPPNDQCAGAITIPANGGQFSGPAGEFADDYNPGSGGCTGFSEPGNDAVYLLNGIAGDVVTATLSAPYDGAVYVVTDCADLNTCIVGDDVGSGDDSVTFTVPTSGPYYIIADAFTTNQSGVYTLDVSVQSPICVPGSTSCVDATNVQFCEAPGLAYTTHACSGGCGPFSCINPNGDTCFEAMDANGVGPFTGSIDTFSADYDPGFSCTGRSEGGQDAAYFVDVNAGQVVQATLTSTFNGALYATQSCTNVADNCLDGSDGAGNEEIGFQAPSDGRYYLVVDTSTTNATGTYSLDVTVSTPVCTANQATCADANTLEVCDGLGLSTTQTTCGFGCNMGACNGPPNDVCATATDITAQASMVNPPPIMGDFTGAADDYTPDFLASCTQYDAIGPDLAYAVTLTTGQTVTATLTATDPLQDTSLYIVSTCAAVVTTECLVGDDQYDGGTGNGTGEMVMYTATADETVYIIADNYDFSSLPATPTFNLQVTIQ